MAVFEPQLFTATKNCALKNHQIYVINASSNNKQGVLETYTDFHMHPTSPGLFCVPFRGESVVLNIQIPVVSFYAGTQPG